MRRFSLIFLCLLSLSFSQLIANGGNQQQFRDIETLLVELRLDHAQDLISQIPEPNYRAFYQSNLDMYRALSSMNPGSIASYREQWDDWFEAVDETPGRDSLKEVMLADMAAKRAIVEFVDHRYLNAVIHVRTARKNLDASFEKYGRMVEQLKLEGLFEVLLGSMPEKYRWIATPLGLSGEVKTGLSYLLISANACRLFNGESQLLLALIEKNVLDQPEKTIQRLARFKRRLVRPAILIDFFQASCYQRLKKNAESLEILSADNRYPSTEVAPFPFWHYLAGKGHYFAGNQREARASFARFLDGYQGTLFKTDATFRTGMTWSLENNTTQARQYFNQIAEPDEEANFDEDNYAAALSRRFLRQAPGPVLLNLFRARNAYDGGYFVKAMSILDQTRSDFALQPAELVEWHYRKARISHDLGQLSVAKDHFEQCLRYTADEYTNWLHAYAAFYLGEIASETQQYSSARAHYKQALEFDGYFYQSGLENRCKSSLSQIKNNRDQASSNRR